MTATTRTGCERVELVAEYALGLMQAETSWPNEHIRRAVLGATASVGESVIGSVGVVAIAPRMRARSTSGAVKRSSSERSSDTVSSMI